MRTCGSGRKLEVNTAAALVALVLLAACGRPAGSAAAAPSAGVEGAVPSPAVAPSAGGERGGEGDGRRGAAGRRRGGVEWSATTPRVNETHIFEGGVNRRGKPVGFHSRPGGRDPEHARVVQLLRSANSRGVYEALVEIEGSGGTVRKRSTFYPDRLDREQVVAAILAAYRDRRPESSGERFRGPSGLGFTIEGYLLDDGSINTAYPIYGGAD